MHDDPPLTRVGEWNQDVALGFPVDPFRQGALISQDMPDAAKSMFIRAWIACAFRHRACAAASGAFLHDLNRAESERDSYLYENALFSFFSAGRSALDSLVFACHALGFAAHPEHFPMSDHAAQRKVCLTLTMKRFTSHNKDSDLVDVLSQLCKDPKYKEWADMRNYVMHRAVPGRTKRFVIHEPSSVAERSPDTWSEFDIALNASLTTTRLAWLECWIAKLMGAALDFRAQSSAGLTRPRRGERT
jgi:hypothetical protein